MKHEKMKCEGGHMELLAYGSPYKRASPRKLSFPAVN